MFLTVQKVLITAKMAKTAIKDRRIWKRGLGGYNFMLSNIQCHGMLVKQYLITIKKLKHGRF